MSGWLWGTNKNDAAIAEANARAAEARADANARAEKARVEANRRAREAEAAYKASVDKARIAANQRMKELAAEAARDEREKKEAAEKREDARTRFLAEMKTQQENAKIAAKAAAQQRDLQHKKKLQEMEDQRKREQEEHKKKMRKMAIDAKKAEVKDKKEQRDNAVKQMRESVDMVNKEIKQDMEELKELEDKHKTAADKLANLIEKIKTFNKDDDPKYKNIKDQMSNALKIFDRDDKEIWAAIEKTGMREDGVGEFLKLTHGIIRETMASQDQANKLDAQLHTFQTLISRECQDKLTIEYLFSERRLDRFIPILSKQNYNECHELICEDDEEFKEDILGLIEEDIKKQIEEWKSKHGDEVDAFEAWLDHYKLSKYKKALEAADLDSFETVADEETLDADTIEDVIKEAEMKKLAEKKFRKAVKEAQNGTYKPPEPEKNDDNKDEEKDDGAKPLSVSKKERRMLKKICRQPKDSWQVLEKEKTDLTKIALVEMSPVFGGFFMRMNEVVKQAQKLLNYGQNLNDEQNKAMKALMENVKSPKAIETAKDDDNKAPDEDGPDEDGPDNQEMKSSSDDDLKKLPDYAQRKGWKEASECQVYSDSKGRWYDGTIIKVDPKDDREIEVKYDVGGYSRTKQVDRYGPEVRDPLVVESRAISAAITVDINVTEIMMSEFNLSVTTLRVLPIARGVEQSTKAILLSQSQIRQSVRLAGAILKLKPANLTKESKPLWNAVDAGIIHIIDSALEMSKISTQYFGYFLRFNQSFQRFISMNKANKDVTLFTSLEHIKNDIQEFSKFKKTFNAKVQELSDEAMKVIKNCVATQIGAQQFEETRAAREKAKEDYLDKKAKYDVESLRLDDKLESLRDEKSLRMGEEGALKIRIDHLTQRKKDNEQFKAQWIKEIDDLSKITYDTGGALDKLVEAEANALKQGK